MTNQSRSGRGRLGPALSDKHGRNPLAVLRDLFTGQVCLPPLTA
ncbi:hypothetical protein [Streptomyces sp. NK08204]|nr:hypothetical protein [Streptomyces sp. NK08204]